MKEYSGENIYDENDEYYPALEACYSLLTDETYLKVMKTLFDNPENKWLNIKSNWFNMQSSEFNELFKTELSIFNVTFEDFEDLFVMWSIPPNSQESEMYLVIFFNGKNFMVNSCTYNYQYMKEKLNLD